MKKIVWLLIIMPMICCANNLYMQENNDGSVVYSDTPLKNGKAIDVSPANQVSTPALASPGISSANQSVTPQAESQNVEKQPYTEFGILSPADQETIQTQPTFQVTFKIQPALQKGDSIQLYVDNQPWGAPAQTNIIDVAQLERGTHQIYAKLLDEGNKVIRQTHAITIYLHRTSKITSPAFKTQSTRNSFIQELLLRLINSN